MNCARSPDGPAEMSVPVDLWPVDHLISGALDDVLADAGGLSGDEFGFYSLLRRCAPATATQVVRWTAMRPRTPACRGGARGHGGDLPRGHPDADRRDRLGRAATATGGYDGPPLTAEEAAHVRTRIDVVRAPRKGITHDAPDSVRPAR